MTLRKGPAWSQGGKRWGVDGPGEMGVLCLAGGKRGGKFWKGGEGQGLCAPLESWGVGGGARGPATGNWRCVLRGGCLWESGLEGLSALVV